MNDLEMELQTIRQKLQTLKASPPETVASPWGQSRQTAPSPDFMQVKTAIETLRQRSEQPHALATLPSSSLQQFDDLVSSIERLAQQQQHALQQLHTVGQRLMGQTQPGTSPSVDDIARFLEECPTIQIPTVERTPQGYLDLNYHIINFHRAEYDATSNAATLRTRSQLFQHPFPNSQEHPDTNHNHDIDSEQTYRGNITDNLMRDVKSFYQIGVRSVRRWLRYRPASNFQHPNGTQFPLLDNAIWCLGAAIARIILNQVLQVYPTLWTPAALIVIVGVVLSLYSSFFSPHPNPTLGSRTLMVILGLVIGGRFFP
ncbi:MAG: hypothetical protein AAF959_02355 [Cyanobacteria bacterium P01_D01_bin.56]